MKKTVSVKELKEYCTKKKPNKVIFYTENQTWYRVSDPCKVQLSFPVMLIFENPNLICLKSGQNTVMFNRVKFAEIETDATVLGTLITVFCGDFNSDGYDISYTLIAA